MTTLTSKESGRWHDLRLLLRVSRPRFWFYLAGPVLVGAAFGASSVPEFLSGTVVFMLAYFLLPANLLLYGINDVYDADIDVYNPKKEDREVVWQGNTVITAAITIASLVGVVLFAITPTAAWPYLVGFFVLAVAYSAPPFRLKSRPFLDSLSNGLYILPGAAMYVTLAGRHLPVLVLAGAWLWTMAMHTFSAIPDIEPDRQGSIRTTATVLGQRATYAYCFVVWSSAMVLFGLVDHRLGLLFSVYPLVVAWIAVSPVGVTTAYWWFPTINTVLGGVLTIAGLWRLQPLVGGIW